MKISSVSHPDKNVSPDESLIFSKGPTPHIRQFMKNNHYAKFAIKMWSVCVMSTRDTQAHLKHIVERLKSRQVEPSP